LYDGFISPFQGLVSIIDLGAGLKSCAVDDGPSGLQYVNKSFCVN
jgi:hypothetical protein